VNVSQSGYSQQNVQISGSAVVNFTPPAVVAHLQGTVTNNGIAVSGATIGASLQGSGNTWVSTTTDGSGRFDIGVTNNGTWNVQLESTYADSNNWVGPSLQEIVSNSQSISGIALHILSGTGTISGYVHNSGGSAVATGVAANATISGTNYFGYANTDGSGNYTLPVINGQWSVNVSQSGYSQQNVQISGSAVVNFTPPAVVAHLQGTATRSGSALAGATIGATNSTTWISTVTDASGNFDLSVPTNGTWYVRLDSYYADGNFLVGPNLTQIVSNNQSIYGISYAVVSATNVISGVVHDSNGNPMTTGVTATTTLYGVNYYVHAYTDGNGFYMLPVINGTWSVGVAIAGYSPQIVNVTGVDFSPSSPFQQWQQTYFSPTQLGNASISGISAPVLSGVGCSNEIAYALGLNPTSAKASDLPTLGSQSVSSVTYECLGFNRNLSATDLTYVVQYSSDLIHWSPLSTFSSGVWSPSSIVTETSTSNANLKYVLVRDSQPPGTASKRFLRLEIIR
ncbi:MAG: carboxypeptidase-like regulatory domain-containing protein, partial [Verrucomicrobiota bacterium]